MNDAAWNPPIATNRLILTPLVPTDADELIDLLKEPLLYRFMGGEPPELEGLRARFERWAPRVSPDGQQRWLNWAIRDATDGHAVGTLQATIRVVDQSSADIGWIIGVQEQGQGYASEASRALVAFLASQGVIEIDARIHPDHEASERVASAIGMQRTQDWFDGECVWKCRA